MQPIPTSIPEPVARSWSADLPEAATREESKEGSVSGLNLEAFMGVKLFAWLGGLALFLGIAFFVKYSFEHNLVTPQMRIAIGTLCGLGLIGGGLRLPRPKFTVTAQTLCATGIVTLYAVTFGAYSLYHFLQLPATFSIMTVITAAAFLLAIQLDAQVVAILGLLGGFLTPLLLSTGQDNPPGLFTYLAVLDAGLIAVALRQRWHYLVMLAAVATGVFQWLWIIPFFQASKIATGATIVLGFEALFLIPFWICNSIKSDEPWTARASALSAGVAISFAGYLLDFPTLAQKPWICLSLLLAADVGLAVRPLRRPRRHIGPFLGGGVVFLILGAWSVQYLTDALLLWALGYFLLFAAFHTALPLALRRFSASKDPLPRSAQLFPFLGLVLMLWPAFHIGASIALWIAILIADLAAIVLATVVASLFGVIATLIVTLIAIALWLFQTPVEAPELTGLLVVIGGFAALFCGASVFLQRYRARSSTTLPYEQEAFDNLPAISVVLPFLLLALAIIRLHPHNPSPIFGVSMFLVIMILALARWSQTVALPPVALVCATLLEYLWRLAWKGPPHAPLPLAWYLGFATLFFLFPLLFQSRKAIQVTAWATGVLALVAHYLIIQDAVAMNWPHFWQSAGGLVPGALAMPPLLASFYLNRNIPDANAARLSILSWFGGVALFFITLIFPVQFHREWLTISWALEGVALLWLFHRLPHRGLLTVGFGLLCAAFVRLSINPAVLDYHERSGTPIWNWYLYTYGIGVACFFVGAWLTAPPRDRLAAIPLPATLYSLGTILLFLLLNIEIADFFATTSTLTFDFESNLARDMTYSIAWSLFALILLLIGMQRQLPAVRYAGIGLLFVTLLKLFLHDLSQLDQLYRIGAFVVVAIVLIGASYLYQRFLAGDEKAPPQA